MKNIKVNIFFDMDGVLAEYHPNTPALMYDKDFFLNRPLEKHAKDLLLKLSENYDVYILSKAITKQCAYEKMLWLDKYLPNIDKRHRFILDYSESKGKYIRDKVDVDNSINILIDDLSANLVEWVKCKNCYPVKYMNNLTSNKWLLTGKPYVSNKDNCIDSYNYIKEMIRRILNDRNNL